MEVLELKGIDKVLAHLNPRVYSKALNRTVNEVGGKTKTFLTTEARKIYNIKASDLKQHMKVKRSIYSTMKYSIDVRSKRFNALPFSPKILKTRGTVSVKIRKDRGRKIINRAFEASNGAILQRIKGSQKIRGVTTVSIPQMFNAKILKKANREVEKSFKPKLQANFNFYISKV